MRIQSLKLFTKIPKENLENQFQKIKKRKEKKIKNYFVRKILKITHQKLKIPSLKNAYSALNFHAKNQPSVNFTTKGHIRNDIHFNSKCERKLLK